MWWGDILCVCLPLNRNCTETAQGHCYAQRDSNTSPFTIHRPSVEGCEFVDMLIALVLDQAP